MPFQVSPGVITREVDLTTVVPSVATTEGAIVGTWKWGPVETRVLVDDEEDLVNRFGKPTNLNAETFWTAANFLAYAKALYVTRVVDTNALNAVSDKSSVDTGVLVKNEDAFEASEPSSKRFLARYAGEIGNAIEVSICDTADKYLLSNVNSGQITSLSVGSDTASVDVDYANVSVTATYQNVQAGDKLNVSGQIMEVKSVNASSIVFTSTYKGAGDVTNIPIVRYWKHYNRVQRAPGSSDWTAARNANTALVDEIHVVVADKTGDITGQPGEILEVWEGLSRATDAKGIAGESIYYKDVINQQSRYVYTVDHASSNVGYANTAVNLAAVDDMSAATQNEYQQFINGVDTNDEANMTIGDIALGVDLYKDGDDVDISLFLGGKALGGTHGETVANYIIDNICEVRKDCVAFVSPDKGDAVNNTGNETDSVVEFRNALSSSSYAVLDSGYKYQYDKYNDVYRWVPLNGDVAGLVSRTDQTNDPWWSPAGFNRGHIKNITKLAWNPSKADRDVLFQADVNPVMTAKGQGTVLFGDKTLLGKPSYFDQIGVRRLFIVLEKAISRAARFTLFEFNDEFTQAQFKNMVEPFLRNVQGRRGITDFQVVIDPAKQVDNDFVGDIYIKPNSSIRYIQLNFVGVRNNVEFSEIVGQF